MTRRGLLVAMGSVAVAGRVSGARAHSYTLRDIFIGHVWSPPGTATEVPVYGPLLNRGKSPDWLIGARSDRAKGVRFVEIDNGAPKPVDRIALPPGKPVTLAPWTLHLVLAGLSAPPKPGDRIPITLAFRDAGEITVESLVEAEPGH